MPSSKNAFIFDHFAAMAAFAPKHEDILDVVDLDHGKASAVMPFSRVAVNSDLLSTHMCLCTQGILYLVCDGHGGEYAAEFVANHLPPLLSRILPLPPLPPLQALSPPATPSPALQPTPSFDRAAEKIRRTIAEAFVAVERQWLEVGDSSGTTVTCLLITGSLLTLANVGDSEAFIDTGCSILELTNSHNIQRNAKEHARLVKAGCRVAKIGLHLRGPAEPGEVGVGPLRVWNKGTGGLCVSRSIGDQGSGPQVVPMPQIKQIILPHQGCRIFLASDGIWDQYTFSRAARMTRGFNAREAALKLAGRDVDPPLQLFVDDASIIVIDALPSLPSNPMQPSTTFPELANKARLHLNLPLARAQDKALRRQKSMEEAGGGVGGCSCFPCGGGGGGGGGGEEDEPCSSIKLDMNQGAEADGSTGNDPPMISSEWPGYLPCYSNVDSLLAFPDILTKHLSAGEAQPTAHQQPMDQDSSLRPPQASPISMSSPSSTPVVARRLTQTSNGPDDDGSSEPSQPLMQRPPRLDRQMSEGRRNADVNSINLRSAGNKRYSHLGGEATATATANTGPPSGSIGYDASVRSLRDRSLRDGSHGGYSERDYDGVRGDSESNFNVVGNSLSQLSSAFASVIRRTTDKSSADTSSRGRHLASATSAKSVRTVRQSIDLTSKGRNLVTRPGRDFWKANVDPQDKIEALHSAVFIPPPGPVSRDSSGHASGSNAHHGKSSGQDTSTKSYYGSQDGSVKAEDRLRSRALIGSFFSTAGGKRSPGAGTSPGQLNSDQVRGQGASMATLEEGYEGPTASDTRRLVGGVVGGGVGGHHHGDGATTGGRESGEMPDGVGRPPRVPGALSKLSNQNPSPISPVTPQIPPPASR